MIMIWSCNIIILCASGSLEKCDSCGQKFSCFHPWIVIDKPPCPNTHALSDPGRVEQWQYCTNCINDESEIPQEKWRLSYEFDVAPRLPIVSMWILVSLNLMAWMIHGNPMTSRSYDLHFLLAIIWELLIYKGIGSGNGRASDKWLRAAIADWEQQQHQLIEKCAMLGCPCSQESQESCALLSRVLC